MATRVSGRDFWGDNPSPLVHYAYKPIQRGQMQKRRPHLLWPTFDRKVNPDGWYQESRRRWVPKLPNAISLLAEKDCPCATPYCKGICYAKIMENSKGVYEAYKHNSDLLRGAISAEAVALLLSELQGSYVFNAIQVQLRRRDRIFRWHPSGDFFSEIHAQGAADAMMAYPGIANYAYTRGFYGVLNVVPILIRVPNLALYISVDEDNVEPARAVFAEYADQGLMLAPTGPDYETTRELHAYVTAGAGRRVAACPENSKANPMNLMDDRRGACVRCLWCPETKVDVMFSESGKEFADASPRQIALTEVRLAAPRRRPATPPPQPPREITEPVRFDSLDSFEKFMGGTPEAGHEFS